jgi:hypothetical protein
MEVEYFSSDRKQTNQTHVTFPERSRDRLKRDLEGLSDIEYKEIFNIIQRKDTQFSENKNGIFINLKYLDDDTVNNIYEFLEFSRNNKKYLKEIEDKQNYEKRCIENTMHQTAVLSKENSANQTITHTTLDIHPTKKTTIDNFTFQNFIDKLTITNMKMFPENDKIVYPTIKQHKWNVNGVKSRLLKKCKEINKYNYDRFLNPYLTSEEESINTLSKPSTISTKSNKEDDEEDEDEIEQDDEEEEEFDTSDDEEEVES